MRRLRDDPTGMGRGELDMPPRVLQWLHTPVIRGDTPLGYLVLLRDVTEERLLERRQNDLTHTMVHDLRNPLTGIWVAIQLLERSFSEGDLSTRQKQMLEILDDSTQRMLSLVNAILDIGRLESGRMPIEYEEIPLDELVADVLDSQTHLAAEKNLRLESALLTEAPIALADPSLIDRVLQNLVGNAIKFTENEGVVKVTIGRETADSPRYLITVQDTGTGIPLDVQGHLFQKFVTGDQVGRGSGLGLAFCKMVLEAHGERMWLADTSEKGTTFCFTLSPPPPETE
jgi:signal transduction histidine kinase